MNAEKEYSKHWLPLLMVGLLALLLLSVAVGSVWAHFEASVNKGLPMQYVPAEHQVYILSAEKDADGEYVTDENGNLKEPEGWEMVILESEEPAAAETVTEDTKEAVFEPGGVYELQLLLTNGRRADSVAAQTQEVSLTLFATQGIVDPNAMMIILRDGGSAYFAAPTAVQEGSAWHETYGSGWTYRFYNASGEELSWTLRGGTLSTREMTLTIAGTGEAAAILTLIASVQPTAE